MFKRASFDFGRLGFVFAAPRGWSCPALPSQCSHPVFPPQPSPTPFAENWIKTEICTTCTRSSAPSLSTTALPRAWRDYEWRCNVFLLTVDRSSKRRQVKPLAASLLEALDYDSSDDSDFKVGDASGKCFLLASLFPAFCSWADFQTFLKKNPFN